MKDSVNELLVRLRSGEFGRYRNPDGPESAKVIEGLLAINNELRGELEKVRHRLRFADAVIRSGDVAALTDAEREAVEWAAFEFDAVRPDNGRASKRAATLRGLLERFQKSLSPMNIPLGPDEEEDEGRIWDSTKNKPD